MAVSEQEVAQEMPPLENRKSLTDVISAQISLLSNVMRERGRSLRGSDVGSRGANAGSSSVKARRVSVPSVSVEETDDALEESRQREDVECESDDADGAAGRAHSRASNQDD